jgi:uncharacterized membrane protein YobD (UPF0266 family)
LVGRFAFDNLIGMAITSFELRSLPQLAAPVFFSLIILLLQQVLLPHSPMQTAVIFTVFVIAMDFLIVAVLINMSFEMF